MTRQVSVGELLHSGYTPVPVWEETMDLVAEIQAVKELSEALGCIVRSFGADTGTLHLLEQDGLLHLKAQSGQFPPPVLAAIREIPIGKGMAGLAVERAQPVDA